MVSFSVWKVANVAASIPKKLYAREYFSLQGRSPVANAFSAILITLIQFHFLTLYERAATNLCSVKFQSPAAFPAFRVSASPSCFVSTFTATIEN